MVNESSFVFGGYINRRSCMATVRSILEGKGIMKNYVFSPGRYPFNDNFFLMTLFAYKTHSI